MMMNAHESMFGVCKENAAAISKKLKVAAFLIGVGAFLPSQRTTEKGKNRNQK